MIYKLIVKQKSLESPSRPKRLL